ncbi:hypothetical protein F2Q69_00035509 [Brassica cretica]|uniref:Uncharacterized protein n=1 Tax=Brassica cretica TaxID=69181 RepID=A0A8S9SLV2_BRACR|nr:hypothetical protein F2Q69_00035509 [Brassica cretica]
MVKVRDGSRFEMVKLTKVEGIVNAEVRSGGSGGSGGSGEETPVRAVVIRGTTEADQYLNYCILVLDAGIDKLSITWKLSSTAKKQANFTTIKVNLCYAPVSQVDRPWRRTENELFKDKTCPHKIITRAYNKSSQSFKYTLDRDIPTGTYFVHTLQENSGILTDIPTENEILGISRGISEETQNWVSSEFPRNIPRDRFLGIYRGTCSSEYSEEYVRRYIPIDRFCFLGIPSENSEGCPRKEEIPRNYFRRLVSSICRRNNDIPTKFRRFFPSESLLFSCSDTYAVDAKDHEVAFGQSTNEAKTTNLFSVQAISGRHKSLDIASVCFSVFSVLALLVFFVNEKRKAKLEQSK